MGMQLFLKECRQNAKSLTYLVYVCCLILFYVTQLGEVSMITEPKPGQERYGTMPSDEESIQMECALNELFQNYEDNSYVTYPLGFYRQAALSDEEQEYVRETIEEVAGEKIETLEESFAMYQEEMEQKMMEGKSILELDTFSIVPDETITYETFLEKMKVIDQMLGGSSRFSEKRIKSEATVEMTYEQAKEEYEKIIEKDKISGAYARLFCDYFGILLAILPVFLAVTRAVRDQRAKAFEVIASKKISTATLVLSRYFAVTAAAITPVIVLAISPAMQTVYMAKTMGISADLWMYGKYIGGWLLPSALFSVAAGFFFSELAGGAAGILVMVLFWIVNLFQSSYQLTGSVGWNVMPRFNSLGKRSVFEGILGELIQNRIGYTIAAVLMVAATIVIYDRKRKGRWKNGRKYH
ncbi:MAG: ABC transporter permease [Lachnospiraceae bacterium]|nr:ABC transporter permease [Robinsoniella sp.]MDY3765346.1 ABC transporter permease [Lachnospiraceae bacterium]